ncbi:unnamed protein product [Phaeothamnion confervicola]
MHLSVRPSIRHDTYLFPLFCHIFSLDILCAGKGSLKRGLIYCFSYACGLVRCRRLVQQGVLNVQVGEDSTWVINKQAPNLQIWWSSPVSGPKRYEYDANAGAWVNTRDGGRMDELVVKELRQACGADVGDRVARALADFAARPT